METIIIIVILAISLGALFSVLKVLSGFSKQKQAMQNMTEEERSEYVRAANDKATAAKQTYEKNQAIKNQVLCPSCGSTDVSFVGDNSKAFSVGKAAAGSLLAGRVGTLAGFAGKKGKSNGWHCVSCGNVFKSKVK